MVLSCSRTVHDAVVTQAVMLAVKVLSVHMQSWSVAEQSPPPMAEMKHGCCKRSVSCCRDRWSQVLTYSTFWVDA